MTDVITLNDEQKFALELLNSGKNVFITGKAGTGKSTVLGGFREQCRDRRVVFLAPTGLAAFQIGGETIHCFFKFPVCDVLTPEMLEPISDKQRQELIRAVDTVVIDEVSMVRSDLFAAIDHRLRELADEDHRMMPFGGKQMIMVGDFLQLPPVLKAVADFDLPGHLSKTHGGIYPFQTRIWQDARIKTYSLRQVMRQQDDRLLRYLNAVRYWNPQRPDRALLAEMNRLLCRAIPRDADIVRLCPRNSEVKRLNQEKFDKLPGEAGIFNAVVEGEFPMADYPNDMMLKLKIDEQVMILCNHRQSDSDSYVNGDIGRIVNISGNDVKVRLTDSREVHVKPMRWSKFRHELETDPETGKDHITSREVGAFTQLPLRAAYALTIHKSQGQTLAKVAVHLGKGCFTHGQLYTALSRCKSLDGIYLESPIREEDIIIDPVILDAYARWDFDVDLFADTLRRRMGALDLAELLPVPEKTRAQGLMKWLEACVDEYLYRQRFGEAIVDLPASPANFNVLMIWHACRRWREKRGVDLRNLVQLLCSLQIVDFAA